ncbi:MAG: hypothetical protein LBG48_06045 [Rickettsiales bacterium]|nr:hypothetical protein [Rickettsiales bacterium]
MKVKGLGLYGFAIMLASCGVRIKKDFIITEVSSERRPAWVKKMMYEPKGSEYKFFVSEAENVDRRLCDKSAGSRGAVLISSEIASRIDNTYQEVAESKNLEKESFSNEKLQQTIKSYLAGIEKHDSYWEKRSYQKKLGSEQDVVKYTCFNLLKMKKTTYDRAVELSVNRMFKEIETENKNEIRQEVRDKLLQE